MDVQELDRKIEIIRGTMETNQSVTNKSIRIIASRIGESHTVTEEELQKIRDDVAKKQDKLVSGANIKTINSNSILGSGNIQIQEPLAFLANSEVNDIFNES